MAVKPAAATLRGIFFAQKVELERAVEVDVFLALGVAIGEMGMHVDETRHHKAAGIIERPITAGTSRRSRFGSDVVEHPFFIENEDLIAAGIVLPSGEELAQRTKDLIA